MKILIVDDLDVNRDLLLRRMQRMGHETGEAVNGLDALDRLERDDWDLVLLDITMPEMDGFETLRRMRADARLAQVPVVMVSAIDDTDSVVRCLELGADDYVTKPFNPIILQARIESSLAKKRLADHRLRLLAAIAREMDIARRIQSGFLPTTMPSVPGWKIAALCRPARDVGGDFFDAFDLPGSLLALAIADVCDKGVGAALYMALFRTLLRTTVPRYAASATAEEALILSVGFINDYIATVHASENMFATVFLAILDPQGGRLLYVNAGHEQPLIRHAADDRLETLDVTGPAVGMMEGSRCTVGSAQLAQGDVFLAYTDGITEAIGAAGEFGSAAVRDALLAASGIEASSMLLGLEAVLSAHVGQHPAHDDVTLLCLTRERCDGTPTGPGSVSAERANPTGRPIEAPILASPTV